MASVSDLIWSNSKISDNYPSQHKIFFFMYCVYTELLIPEFTSIYNIKDKAMLVHMSSNLSILRQPRKCFFAHLCVHLYKQKRLQLNIVYHSHFLYHIFSTIEQIAKVHFTTVVILKFYHYNNNTCKELKITSNIQHYRSIGNANILQSLCYLKFLHHNAAIHIRILDNFKFPNCR